MDKEKAQGLLKDVKTIMDQTQVRTSRPVGSLLLVWGAVWLAGFVCGQFVSIESSRIIWLGLNVAAIVITILLSVRMYGRRNPHHMQGLGKKIALSVIGISIIGFLSGYLLRLSAPREVTLLIVITASISYFYVGIFTQIQKSFLGLGLIITTFLIDLLLPDWFYLGIGVAGGTVFFLSALPLLRAQQD